MLQIGPPCRHACNLGALQLTYRKGADSRPLVLTDMHSHDDLIIEPIIVAKYRRLSNIRELPEPLVSGVGTAAAADPPPLHSLDLLQDDMNRS